MDKQTAHDLILGILQGDAGMTPENVADAICAAVFPDAAPVVVTNPGSRDETHASVDPNTGTLTAEAIARRESDQAAAVAADDSALAADQAAVDADQVALNAAEKKKADDQAQRDADYARAVDPNA